MNPFTVRFSTVVFWLMLCSASVSAQPSSGTDGGNMKSTAMISAAPNAANRYPPDAAPQFFRGNDADPYYNGFYLHATFFAVPSLFLVWVWSSRWVNDDSRALKIRNEFWNSWVFGCGVLGFLAILCLRQFWLGSIALIGLYGVPLGLYIRERNERVPESAKLLTRRHLHSLLNRGLARLGVGVVSPNVQMSAAGPPIRFIGKTSTDRGDEETRSRQAESSKGFLAAKELIYDAIQRRCSDIHLEPKDDELAIRLRIDGVMFPADPFDRAIGQSLINIFKVLGAIDITEKRRPQDGSFRAKLKKREVDFRVATQGTRHGEKMSLRILDQANSVSTLDQLGLRRQLLTQLREIVHQPHGMFLCCGPTGAGKSTTLYAAINDIDTYQQNVITIEDPIEYKMDNVNQIEINTKAGQNFAKSMRSILRQDPDIVMVGEIRDGETGEIACQAANTGHMVFSTIHANDTITAVFRFLELDVEPYMAANSISAIMGQRLVRRLCSECRVPYKPKPELLKKLNLPASKVERFYRAHTEEDNNCPTCGGMGYWGRIGVYELLVVTDEVRDLIREKKSAAEIKKLARRNGMLSMKEEGLRLVVRGITSLSELQRVVK